MLSADSILCVDYFEKQQHAEWTADKVIFILRQKAHYLDPFVSSGHSMSLVI